MSRHIIACLLMLILFSVCMNRAFAGDTGRGIQFEMYDENNVSYTSPSFKFAIRLADGNLIGWDKASGQWSGAVSDTEIDTGVFNYPGPGYECTSTKAHIGRTINFPPDVEGEYGLHEAMYCMRMGISSFLGSGAEGIIGGVPDGNIDVTIYPEADVIIFACFDFLVDGLEPLNVFCLNKNLNRRLILASGVEQKVELNYDFNSETNTTVHKVITPSNLYGSWETCRTLGLVKNQGLYTSVQRKLDNAKRKYDSGEVNAANNIYGALVNELEAQYGKGIDPQCADILIEDLKSGVR